ncbi:MAG: 2-C-methyl-D-erythritol 4-phosphate cytidylyltransferase [Acidobacteria bacterium]|nr:2-C-methyl-D-erythritol 4-phosphate cytidylyltransferase [Acidobacteriota bacterium]
MHVTAIIAAGGVGRRVGAAIPKQLLEIGGRTMLERTVSAFTSHPRIADVIVAVPAEVAAAPPSWLSRHGSVRVVAGGLRRQDSVAAAFDRVPAASDIVLVHDAARPFVSADLIGRCIDAAAAFGGAIAALPASDTVKRVVAGDAAPVIDATLPRESIYLAQTPQAFQRAVLSAAVELGRSGVEGTDEASLAERAGHAVRVVEGDPANVKITTPEDLENAQRKSAPSLSETARVGIGYDLHRLVSGRPLVLGGVTIPFEKGADGHSDADVVCHAITDAILGAACRGDIGVHFPDSDPQWKGASSVLLLQRAAGVVREAGYDISQVDVVVILERPKIAPFKDAIRRCLADALGIAIEHVSMKGKTNEGVDAIGRGEAIAAHAVAVIQRSSFLRSSFIVHR